MDKANNVVKFLKVNEFQIGKKINDRAEEEGKKLLPALKKKYKSDINKSKGLTKAIYKLEKERDKLGRKLEAIGLEVGEYDIRVRFDDRILRTKYNKEVADIKNEAILTGVTPELTKRLLALL